jgi:hypothetical protein
MKPKLLIKAACFSLALTTSFGLSAQVTPPSEMPMPPAMPTPTPAPVEQPAPPVLPTPPASMDTMPDVPQTPAVYPPCSATLLDRCKNSRPEADVPAQHPVAKQMRRHHHRRHHSGR